ncbi:MAG: ferric reductase-like transmembrane domain-containing protein [Pseudomonadota bacterium]
MSHQYQAVVWNRQKRIYDLTLLVGLLVFFGVWIGGHLAMRPNVTAEAMLIRGLAVAAFLLLHVILSIGPLCRLDTRFLPLLYNRRHLGVTMFLLAAAHGAFAIVQFHGFSDLNPLVSLLSTNSNLSDVAEFPFQPLGLFALLILFLMAATSHDFWLANLSAPVWKALHMGVYVAYVLIVAHVALGVLQSETDPALAAIVALGMAWVLGLHAVSALHDARDESRLTPDLSSDPDWVNAGPIRSMPDGRARMVVVAGERVAIFRNGESVTAVSAVCQHQNGPLGEGCVIDGLITCPWHGYQYEPRNGRSPPPFTETIPTFDLKTDGENVFVRAVPNQPGTPTTPLSWSDAKL